MRLQPTPQGFLRDGQPHLIVSGAVHYFRVPPELWRDRLLRVKAMGCNTVETYVAWNFHAPTADQVDFSGWRDLELFLQTAAEIGLDAIVRPGPYICAEWEGGGFPGWLLRDRNLRLRVNDPGYLAHVDRWFDELIPRIARHQASRGGNVVMVQVENEYGSFGDDRAHLEHLRDGLLARGIDELLVTSDGPGQAWLSGGTVDGALATVNFGSRADEVIEMCRTELPDQPLMCMEFWNGWFDHWGEGHHTRPADSAAAELETMLAHGMSVNLYMAHGGTNFGLWAGANHHAEYLEAGLQPTVTSYDYDAAIGEDGRLTPKFHAFREVIGRHLDLAAANEALALVPEQKVLPEARLDLEWRGLVGTDLWQRLDSGGHPHPPTFEDLGLERGALLLKRRTQLSDWPATVKLLGLHDRAWVFCDGQYVGVCDRNDEAPELTLPTSSASGEGRREVDLEILVESQGRVNFGPHLPDRKGILRGVWLSPRFLNGWQVTAWPLEQMAADLRAVASSDALVGEPNGPSVATVTIDVDEPADTYLDTSGLGRGVVWVGDFCLGRFDQRGPQTTLYVPAPLLADGSTTITLLDFEPTGATSIGLVAHPSL
ncbi:glycoside hydrolase family 35 protein [Aestuariimicrobium sp. T2.26MG-19.2B]|uniref:glycoside hydrolase family 35 protein n=1 Tax=Aestuariimicrobium sp. T2.26MG-19.2B TaxID=3040679 RepID=UPI0024774CCE|nr:beta-galactosidase family protein [Aestuariimicrobium sp. T2.26MG-19.2B]CAI9406761.1 Beta-galactosidase [Aestuariimicrobium sp. T2.26MG-19.2B]